MFSDEELGRLLMGGETDRVELKCSAADRIDIKKTICALANDLPNHQLPGVIFIGVNDDGSCANLEIDDDLLLKLAHAKDDGQILPFPTMFVEKKKVRGCELVVIVVSPSFNAPIRYDGRVWVRPGPKNAKASPDDERMLREKRRASDLSFDQLPLTGSTLNDLDMEFFSREYLPSAFAPEVLLENNRTVEHQLLSLGLLANQGVPSVASILFFGKDTSQWFPGAYIQFVRWEGGNLADSAILDQKRVDGPIYKQLRMIDEILNINISTSSDVRKGLVEIKTPDYPIVALQQFCRNAVMHRTYENTNAPSRVYWFNDRIEIDSPGGLFGRVNERNFGKSVTDYRNPKLAEAMAVLGFVQKFGMGIPMALQALSRNGNPDPEFGFEGSRLLVTIRKRK